MNSHATRPQAGDATSSILTPGPILAQQRTGPAEVRLAVQSALERLLAWSEASDPVTPDPYDVKRHTKVAQWLATRKQVTSALGLKATYAMTAIFPNVFPRLLGIERKQTSGALAWMAQGYMQVYSCTRDPKYLRQAETWLEQLLSMSLDGHNHYCWGFYSDWQTSTVLIPVNTPLLYSNYLAARAFMDHYIATGKPDSLAVVISTCVGTLKDLSNEIDDDRLFLTYSPYDTMQVFNTNALFGDFLCEVGAVCRRPDLIKSGVRMLNWVAEGIRPDGRCEYFSRVHHPHGSEVDHYHTAMTIQGLLCGCVRLDAQQWIPPLQQALKFYLTHMFDKAGRPKFTPTRTFPIDVMSCAEALMLLCKVRSSSLPLANAMGPLALERMHQVADFVCRELQSESGAFYYRLYRWRRLPLFSFRWGQGAMLRALACYINHQ
jgi:hypothetical protein